MARLINADELLLRFIPRGGDNNFTRFVRETVRLRLAEMPTIEAEPVKHGRWVDMGDFEQCSVCQGTHLKEFATYYGNALWVKTPYCHNCGAKMDEVTE